MKPQSKAYLEEAYKSYYLAFIKKAKDILQEHDGADKAFDCIQEIVLRLLQMDFEFESMAHARSIIYMNISWQCHKIRTSRKKWGVRERKFDFSIPKVQSVFSAEEAPNVKSILSYWPLSEKYFKHIGKLCKNHQTILKLTLLGYTPTEIKHLLNLNILATSVGASKIEAINMLRNFKVASKLRNPLDRSMKRRGSDDRTDKIMEMTKQGLSTKEIAEKLGLSESNVKCRRFDRKRLLEKIKNI